MQNQSLNPEGELKLNNDSAQKYLTKLIELTSQKLSVLAEVADLCIAQQKHIMDDRIDELEASVGQKQAYIDKIKLLDEQYEVYFKRMKFELKIKNMEELIHKNICSDLICDLKAYTAKVLDLTSSITEYERKNQMLIEQFMEEIKKDLNLINNSKKLGGAYTPTGSAGQSSYFIDSKK